MMETYDQVMASYTKEQLVKMRDECLNLAALAETKGALEKAETALLDAGRYEVYRLENYPE